MSSRPRTASRMALGLAALLVTGTLTGSVQGGAASAAVQSGTTSLSPANVQPGRRPASSDKADLVGTVKFSPARKGRPVQIQRSLDGVTWTDVGKAKKQNGAGAVSFTAAAAKGGQPYSYLGVAKKWRGMARYTSTQSSEVWQEKFVDDFGGTTLGDQWAHRRPDSKECAKVGDSRATKVAKGTLRLSVKRDPNKLRRKCKVPGYGTFRYYLNGQVSTQEVPHAFKHGTMSARIKFHSRRGAHGAFWMQPMIRTDGARPALAGAEIDIAEFFGKGYQKGGLASFVYNYGVRKKGKPIKIGGMVPKATRMLPKRDAWWKKYHVFSLEWTENAYRFSVDGRTHSTLTRGVTSVEQFMILGLMTSAWELKQAKKLGINPVDTMNVDWVKVWQKD